MRLRLLSILSLMLGMAAPAWADGTNGRLDIYFIDVEGGASTLIVTPQGESILVDSGYPDNNRRDLNRILKVVREVAKLDRINHAVVTHWHRDHYGNHAALAAEIPIENFSDRGIPDALKEDKEFQQRIAEYRAASQNQSQTLRAGDEFELYDAEPKLTAIVLAADREVIANTGKPNPFAAENVPRDNDPSDNAASIAFRLDFGKFRFLCCGDLSWNIEAKLVMPNNPIGKIDLFMVTHHGHVQSNNPTLVRAIDPITAVMCNGPTKAGDIRSIKTVQSCPSLEAFYQLHRNVALKDEDQVPAEFIANRGTTDECEGVWIKASVAPDGESYTIQIGPDGTPRTFQSRGDER